MAVIIAVPAAVRSLRSSPAELVEKPVRKKLPNRNVMLMNLSPAKACGSVSVHQNKLSTGVVVISE
jgi:hypothetical protein